MKKKILILGFATLLCSVQYSFAGDANPMQVKCFEADGTTVYDVRGCVPGSDISFYSQQGGGAMMQELAVNALGHARVLWSQKATPAFVLNVLNTNSAGIAGNGMVTFTGNKEFIVKNVALDNNSGSVTLRWNGSVNIPGSYTFQVLKSENGSDWSVIQTVNALSNEVLPYSFTDQSQSNVAALYQVQVIDNTNDVYYTSGTLAANGLDGISVYPTIAHNSINILLNDTRNASYKIVNMLGQVMASGTLNNTMSSCNVAALPDGNYLVEVSNAGKQTTTKFVKE